MEQITELLVTNKFTKRDWLNHYKNVWMRNSVARTIDLELDKMNAAIDPNIVVTMDGSRETVKVIRRAEMRKMALTDCLELLKAIDILLALSDEELDARWSEEAIKLNPELTPRKYVVKAEAGVKLPTGQQFPKDTVLTINPEEDELKPLLESGQLEEVVPGAEKKEEVTAPQQDQVQA